jgi:hypothetical protein
MEYPWPLQAVAQVVEAVVMWALQVVRRRQALLDRQHQLKVKTVPTSPATVGVAAVAAGAM